MAKALAQHGFSTAPAFRPRDLLQLFSMDNNPQWEPLFKWVIKYYIPEYMQLGCMDGDLNVSVRPTSFGKGCLS